MFKSQVPADETHRFPLVTMVIGYARRYVLQVSMKQDVNEKKTRAKEGKDA